MVLMALQINANLENVQELKTNPNYTFLIKLVCTNCGVTSNKWHNISQSNKIQHYKTRNQGECNFQIKCKMCGRINSVDIIEKSNDIYSRGDTGKFKSIVTFDCRGVEPVEFLPCSGWVVQSSDCCEIFDNVDLSEKDWVEYDQCHKRSLGIYDLTSNLLFQTNAIIQKYVPFPKHGIKKS